MYKVKTPMSGGQEGWMQGTSADDGFRVSCMEVRLRRCGYAILVPGSLPKSHRLMDCHRGPALITVYTHAERPSISPSSPVPLTRASPSRVAVGVRKFKIVQVTLFLACFSPAKKSAFEYLFLTASQSASIKQGCHRV